MSGLTRDKGPLSGGIRSEIPLGAPAIGAAVQSSPRARELEDGQDGRAAAKPGRDRDNEHETDRFSLDLQAVSGEKVIDFDSSVKMGRMGARGAILAILLLVSASLCGCAQACYAVKSSYIVNLKGPIGAENTTAGMLAAGWEALRDKMALYNVAYVQNQADSRKYKVIVMHFEEMNNRKVMLSVTPNHFLVNSKRQLMRADRFKVGDRVWYAHSKTHQLDLVKISGLQSGCERVNNLVSMADYISINSIVLSCLSEVHLWDISIAEVPWVLRLGRLLYRMGLRRINSYLDNLFVNQGFSVCGELC
mmetsp:Transcript_8795/g.26437  ORF Transcript_8795/g.26437 Transcript_8795/m.26437 type:complete len:306 (+) Transcript_8795:312-1229(+)